MAKVYHSEIYGLRETKYDWLNKHNIKNVKWNELEPNNGFYLLFLKTKDCKKVSEFNREKTEKSLKVNREQFIELKLKESLFYQFEILNNYYIIKSQNNLIVVEDNSSCLRSSKIANSRLKGKNETVNFNKKID